MADVAQESGPSVHANQLLRSNPDMLQSRADIGNKGFDGVGLRMHRRQAQLRLPAVTGGLALSPQALRVSGVEVNGQGQKLKKLNSPRAYCVTIGDVIKLTGVSRNTQKRHFRNLVEYGHLNQQGSGRGVGYELEP